MKNTFTVSFLVLLFAVLMSIPWLVPGCGWAALFAFVPLLMADSFAEEKHVGHFWIYQYCGFVLWNAFATFWISNATLGGGVFAVLANALQMSLVFGVFRWSRKYLHGCLPYILLVTLWVTWEKLYFNAQISWPWLVLGNAFAGTVKLVQWYEYTGTLGGSLWIWASNIAVFGILRSWRNSISYPGIALALVLLIVPPVISLNIYSRYVEKSEGTVDVLIAQPNFDPYEKFSSMSRQEQNNVLLELFSEADDSSGMMYIAPETFTGDVFLNDVEGSLTVRALNGFISDRKNSSVLLGASTYKFYPTHSAPSILARPYGNEGWIESRNSALLLGSGSEPEICHKGKLVVGVELTPFPKVFVPFDNWLSKKMGVNGLMGRDVPQEEVSALHFNGIPFGCAICYESVYGEYCTEYVKKGAEFLTVITNDAWWGDTPGYRQHFNYSRLRAIELRRDIARCGNTGLSAVIDQKGDVLSSTGWWTRTSLAGTLNRNTFKTFFVRYGDIAGRICTLLSVLLVLLSLVRFFTVEK